MTVQALELEEAVPLGYAVCARVAADLGVRLLAIKGPVLAAQGLREPRVSVDVDVWVDPAALDRFRAGLTDAGWADTGVYDTPSIMPIHSFTFGHELWPCEVDVHHLFPGFLAQPQVVFDALWDGAVQVELAHTSVVAPSRVGHAAIAALHYLRDQTTTWGQARLDDLAGVVRGSFDPRELETLVGLAHQAGASDTLAPFLTRLGLTPLASDFRGSEAFAEWELRTLVPTQEVLPWLVGLRRTPWYRRPGYLVRALWDGDKAFRSWDRSTKESRRALRQARIQRLRRGLRVMPHVYADLRRRSGERSRGGR